MNSDSEARNFYNDIVVEIRPKKVSIGADTYLAYPVHATMVKTSWRAGRKI